MAEPLQDTFDPTKPVRLTFDGSPRSGHVTDSDGREIYVKNVSIKVGVDHEPPEVSIDLVTMPFEYAGPADYYVICEHCGERSAVLLLHDQVDG